MVGTNVGSIVGNALGDGVFLVDGLRVDGFMDGATVGFVDGSKEGKIVLGSLVGKNVGGRVGFIAGIFVGFVEGYLVGSVEGAIVVGSLVGTTHTREHESVSLSHLAKGLQQPPLLHPVPLFVSTQEFTLYE